MNRAEAVGLMGVEGGFVVVGAAEIRGAEEGVVLVLAGAQKFGSSP